MIAGGLPTRQRRLVEAWAELHQQELLDDWNRLQRAFVRSLEVIGEAAERVPVDMRVRHPEVQWRAMTGMRDRLIHEYFGVDLDLVWDVVPHKIPALRVHVERIIATR